MAARRRNGVARPLSLSFCTGAALLLLALILMGLDGWAWLHGAEPGLSTLGDVWYRLHPESLRVLQHAAQHIADFAWDPVIVNLLRLPLVPVLALLGMVLSRAGAP
jgi:hypothetical protein